MPFASVGRVVSATKLKLASALSADAGKKLADLSVSAHLCCISLYAVSRCRTTANSSIYWLLNCVVIICINNKYYMQLILYIHV